MPRETILVLESDPHLTQGLAVLLEARGIEVLVMGDVLAALRRAWEQPVRLVILDLSRPVHDGVVFLKGLKSEPAPPKILAVGPREVLEDLKHALRKEHRPDHQMIAPQTPQAVAKWIEGAWKPSLSGQGALHELAPDDKTFAHVLVGLWRRSETGVLNVRAKGIDTTIYVVNGEPVFSERGSMGDTLGRMLVRTGFLTEAQLSQAIAKMTEKLIGNELMRLGEILIELGMLSPEQVHDGLQLQVRQKVLACFHWNEIEHTFEKRDDFLQEIGMFKCPVPPLLLEGIRQAYDPARLKLLLGPHRDRYPRLLEDLGTISNRFRLTAGEQRFLRGLTGDRTLASLEESSNLDPVAAGHVLAALIYASLIELRSEPSQAKPAEGSQDIQRPTSSHHVAGEGGHVVAEYIRIKGRSDAEVLRVRHDATPAEIREAFASGAKRYGPEATQGFAPNVQRKASEIFALMRASHDRMLAASRPKRNDALSSSPSSAAAGQRASDRQARFIAEVAYQKGKRFLIENSHVMALEEFKRASSALPEVFEYRLLASYAEYLLASDDEARKSCRERTRDLAERTLAQDPRHAKAHFILGRFLRLEGRREEAERHLKLAVSADPTDPLPATELRLLRKVDEKPKRRLW